MYLQAEYVTERNGLNQVSIYDRIIRSQDKANLNWLVSQEYKMIDQGNYLRGRQLNMTLCWDIMPRVGAQPISRTCTIGRSSVFSPAWSRSSALGPSVRHPSAHRATELCNVDPFYVLQVHCGSTFGV